MDINENRKPVGQMTDEELVEDGKNRASNGLKRIFSGLLLLLVLGGIFAVGNSILNPYPEVTSINTLYNMDYAGDYILENIGAKVQYCDIVIWQIDAENGAVRDLLSDIYFSDHDAVKQITPLSMITIKGTIDGLSESNRLVIRDAILVEVQSANQHGDSTDSMASLPPDDYYEISITGDQLIEEADANVARMLNTYAGKRVIVNDLEITQVFSDSAMFNILESIYFRYDEDLYSIAEGDHITVIGSIREEFGTYCIDDAVLLPLDSATSDVQSNYEGDGPWLSDRYGYYTNENGDGFVYTMDNSEAAVLFSYGPQDSAYFEAYIYGDSHDGPIYSYNMENILYLTLIEPGEIYLSCDSSTFEGIPGERIEGTYYLTEPYYFLE